MPERSFDESLASLLALAERREVLGRRLQGLEFADERGWLSEDDARALAVGLEEEREARDAFGAALERLRTAWRDDWKTWLLDLSRRTELSTERDSGLASAVETLRAEAEDRSKRFSLAWALCRGVAAGGASHPGAAS